MGPLRPSVCPSATLSGCLVCVIYNSKNFHFFLFKLCIMIDYILKMCTTYFVRISWIFSHFLGVLNLDIFPSKNAEMVSVICNSNNFHYLIFKLCSLFPNFAYWLFTHWRCAPSILCTFDKYFLIFDGCWTKPFFYPRCVGGVWLVMV